MESRKNIFLRSALFSLIFCSLISNLNATTLDGTSNVVYKNRHHVFHNSDDAQGFVTLKGGFTVLENSTATLSIAGSVFSGIDLRNDGILKLNNNLYLSSNITLSSFSTERYGYIRGEGHTIYLGGDLNISDAINLVITDSGKYSQGYQNSLIIDGQGHSIILGHRSQILVDAGVTLTLRNLTVKNTLNTFVSPAIKCSDWYSKLTLDNVEIAFNDDFAFTNGQLFFNNDVVYSGTSTFIYRSVRPSYIMQNSCLHFDPCTTFYYDTANGLNTGSESNKDLINMYDETSCMFFDNCTLKTTHTGIRMTKGKAFFDNKVTMSSALSRLFDGSSRITSVATTSEAENTFSVAWRPDGKFLAVGNSVANQDRIYSWDGTTLTSVATTAAFEDAVSIAWSPDGRFLAVGNTSSTANRIYSWDGTTLTLVATTAETESTRSVAWSPDGKFLAAGNASPTANRIYSWDGTTLTPVVITSETENTNAVAWSPDGQFLAVGNNNQADRIYSWDGTTLTSVATTSETASSKSMAWSPDGRFLAVGNSSVANRIYSWDGTALTSVATTAEIESTGSVAWSPDGQFLAAGNSASTTNRIYIWDGTALTSVATTSATEITNSIAWSPDGKFLAAGNGTTTVNRIQKISYGFSPTSQAFTNSIIFGNSSQGSDYDADVFVLGGTRVELDGLINYDNVN